MKSTEEVKWQVQRMGRSRVARCFVPIPLGWKDEKPILISSWQNSNLVLAYKSLRIWSREIRTEPPAAKNRPENSAISVFSEMAYTLISVSLSYSSVSQL